MNRVKSFNTVMGQMTKTFQRKKNRTELLIFCVSTEILDSIGIRAEDT